MKYRTIVADPPWRYGSPMRQSIALATVASVDLPYPSMSVEEIAALPVLEMGDPEGCRCFLWTTNTHLPHAFDILYQWGFVYRQMLVWHKTKSTPQGHIAPNRAEFLLVGRRGNPETLTRWPNAVILASPTKHSTKPEVFMDLIEASSPGPYLEMFARRNRLGWDTWGNEALEMVDL